MSKPNLKSRHAGRPAKSNKAKEIFSHLFAGLSSHTQKLDHNRDIVPPTSSQNNTNRQHSSIVDVSDRADVSAVPTTVIDLSDSVNSSLIDLTDNDNSRLEAQSSQEPMEEPEENLQDSSQESLTEESETKVLNKFESIWKLIFNLRMQLSRVMLPAEKTDEGKGQQQDKGGEGGGASVPAAGGPAHPDYPEAVRVLHRVGNLMLSLKDVFSRCMEISPLLLPDSPADTSGLADCLNNFLSRSQVAVDDTSPLVTHKQLAMYFAAGKRRPLLLAGLEQLTSFIEDFKKLNDTVVQGETVS